MSQVVPPIIKAALRKPLGAEPSTKAGAQALARAIVASWARVGKTVRAWVEPGGSITPGKPAIWIVKSSLVNGLPA